MKSLLLVTLLLLPALSSGAGLPAPEDLVPFAWDGSGDSGASEIAGITIHSKEACLGLLQPILSPEAVISAGLKALSSPAPSNLGCLDSLLGDWDSKTLPAPDPYPNRLRDLMAEKDVWRARVNYLGKRIRCFNPEKPGSPEYSVFAGMNSAVCDGFWLSKASYLKLKPAHEEAEKNSFRIDAELRWREKFPSGAAALLAKDSSQIAALGSMLGRPDSAALVDREKIYGAYVAFVCAKLKPTDDPDEKAIRGEIAACYSRKLSINTAPAPLEANLHALLPDPGGTLDEWKNGSTARFKFVTAQRTERSNQLTFNYGLRRLLTAYAFAAKSATSASLGDFCAANEAALRADKEIAITDALKPFKKPDQWLLASKYGISEVEASGIDAYTGSYYEGINNLIWKTDKFAYSKDYTRKATALEAALKSGLARLPAYSGRPVMRFSTLPPEVLADHQVGKIITYSAYTSTSRKEDWAWGDGKSHKFLIFAGRNGKDVTSFSANPYEEEVLFKAGTRFKVLSRKTFTEGLFEFVLAEVDEAGEVIAKIPGKP